MCAHGFFSSAIALHRRTQAALEVVAEPPSSFDRAGVNSYELFLTNLLMSIFRLFNYRAPCGTV